MKKIILIYLMVFCTSYSNAQINTLSEYDYVGENYGSEVIKVGRDGHYGFIDINGKEVIPLVYENVGDFYYQHTIAPIVYNGKLGFIDTKGKNVTALKYEGGCYNQCTDYPIILLNGKYGYLNEQGIELIPPIYDDIGYLKKGKVSYAKKGDYYGFINETGKVCIPFIYTAIKNKDIIDTSHRGQDNQASNDFCCVCQNGLYGYVDKKRGIEVISPRYIDAKNFSEGLAAVKVGEKYGYINELGEMIIAPEFDNAQPFRFGRAIVEYHEKKILIDENGNKLKYKFNFPLSLTTDYGEKIKYEKEIYEIKTNDYGYIGRIVSKGRNGIGVHDVYMDSYCNVYLSYYKILNSEIAYLYECGKKGNSEAFLTIGRCFYEGRGILTEYDNAFKWFSKAAELNNADAMCYLGKMCEYGQGTELNINDAVRWYRKSADLGNIDAQIELSKLKLLDIHTNSLATIIWNNAVSTIVTEKIFMIDFSIKSDSKIENVSIDVNGILDRGIKTIESDNYDMKISRIITLSEGENVIKVSVTNGAGTTQEEKTIVYRPQGGELPTIEWLDFAATANKKEYQMKLGIKSKTKVEEVNVTVNGTQTRGIKPVPTDGYDLTVDRTLALSEGVNRIVVSVRNGDGIATSEKVITYQGVNPTPIFNDKRIAFVVGNSHYSNSEMNLVNPENDAKDVAEKLKGLGFEVVLILDASLETMDKELSLFKEKAKDYDVALFYYAGHGIQNKGMNYIIPTNIEGLSEDNLKYKCVNVERVLDIMEDSQCKLKIVILDACRNDPVSRKWHRSTGTRGLSIMNAPTGTIISFSTSPGSTALDGTGRNSPYTQAFLNTLDMPNLDVFHFFQKVGASVLDMTQKAQNPWLSVSFTGDFYFNMQ